MSKQTQETTPGGSNKFASLKTAIDASHVKQREGWRDRNGNAHMVDYVEWHTVADILDEHAPRWTHQVKDISQIGVISIVIVAVTIDGITREGIGTGAADTELGIKKAEHDALKRAAVKFGVGRDLYKKESDLIEKQGAASQCPRGGGSSDEKPLNPIAANLMDSATDKQLGMIRAIAREARINHEDECHACWENVRIDQLSKRAASWFIGHLQKLENSGESVPEVRTGIPISAPVQNIREFAQKQVQAKTAAPPASTSAAPATNAEDMRSSIVEKFKAIGLSPDASLAGFDREKDVTQKRQVYNGILNFVVQTKREQIKKALADSNWDPEEIEGDLARFGIVNGLNKATPAQVEAMWLDYKHGRQV